MTTAKQTPKDTPAANAVVIPLDHRVRPLTDKERLDFLQWLITRTEFQNQRAGSIAVGSDMHIGGGWCGLYVRNLFGNPIKGGISSARDVREAIDAVAHKLRPNAKLTGQGGA